MWRETTPRRGVWQPVAPPVDPPGSPLVWLVLAYLYYYFAVEFGVVVEAALLAVPLYVLLGRYLAGYAETEPQNESLPASERTLVAGTAGAVVLLSVGTAGVYVLDFRGLGAELPSVVLSATTTLLGLGTLCCWVCFDGLLARDWMYNEGVERPLAREYAAVLPLFEFALLSQVSAPRAGPTLLVLPLSPPEPEVEAADEAARHGGRREDRRDPPVRYLGGGLAGVEQAPGEGVPPDAHVPLLFEEGEEREFQPDDEGENLRDLLREVADEPADDRAGAELQSERLRVDLEEHTPLLHARGYGFCGATAAVKRPAACGGLKTVPYQPGSMQDRPTEVADRRG